MMEMLEPLFAQPARQFPTRGIDGSSQRRHPGQVHNAAEPVLSQNVTASVDEHGELHPRFPNERRQGIGKRILNITELAEHLNRAFNRSQLIGRTPHRQSYLAYVGTLVHHRHERQFFFTGNEDSPVLRLELN